MTRSLQKQIEQIVEADMGQGWKCIQIKQLVKTQLEELQEMLKEREFDTGNWTEEMNHFVGAYIDNL